MARLKHNPTRPDSGFNPIQLSRGEISRMREETNRVVQNMERNRLAQLEQGKANLQALRDDADYTRRAEARNFEIQQKNAQVDLIQSQLDAQTAERQAAVTSETARQIFGSLASFSKTAAESAQERAVIQAKRESDISYMSASLNPDHTKEVFYNNVLSGLLEDSERYQGALTVEEANGGDPTAIGDGRLADPAITHLSNKGNATFAFSNNYPIIFEAILNSDREFEFKGQMVSFAQARGNPELMAVVATLAKRVTIDKFNLRGLEDQFLVPGLKIADEYAQRQIANATVIKNKNTYAMREDEAFGILRNNVNGLQQFGAYVFRRWSEDPNLGYSGALGNYEKLATDRDQDGNFRFSMEDLGSLDLKSNGRTFAEEWPSRWTAMQEARVKSQMEYDKRELQLDDIAYEKDSQRIRQGFAEDPTQANAEAAIKFFRDTYAQVPPWLQKAASSYTVEALQKEEAVKKLEAIPPGLITREAVDAAYAVDPAAGARMQKRLEAQEARYNTGIYKETAESFKATANGVTSFGTNKPNTPSSVFLQERMKAEYRRRVDQAVAGGMDFNQAATTIGQTLDAEVKAGARDPNSPWYRKADSPGGAAQFPNLNKGTASALERANRRYEELKNFVRDNGLQKTLDTKNTIITAEEAPALVQSYGKPGFSIPQDVLAVSGMSNGLDPMVIINRQLAQHGIAPLQPPPSLSTVSQTISPAFQKLLYKSPSVNRSARALGSTNMFNPTLIPNNLAPIIQQAAQANGVSPSYIAALAEIESGFNPNSTSYNGSSLGVMQINRAAHPAFFAQNDWKDPQANINYGAQYYAGLLKKYGDPVAAVMAYNAGPGNYDAYLRGELPDGPVKREMLNHGKKFGIALNKYGGSSISLNNPNVMRTGHSNMKLTASANSYVGMDTSDGPDEGRNACVWALNKVMRAAGMEVPWGNSLYVPFVKGVLDKTARRVSGPMPGAIAIMQDNHPTDPYPHIGIVGADGMIISNSTSRARFDWKGTPQEYEQKYGRPNLYYMLN